MTLKVKKKQTEEKLQPCRQEKVERGPQAEGSTTKDDSVTATGRESEGLQVGWTGKEQPGHTGVESVVRSVYQGTDI